MWFLYRRMVINFFAVCGVTKFLDAITDKFIPKLGLEILGDVLTLSIFLAFVVLCMRYADYMYLLHADKKVAKGVVKSGTSLIAASVPILLAAGFFIAVFILGTQPS